MTLKHIFASFLLLSLFTQNQCVKVSSSSQVYQLEPDNGTITVDCGGAADDQTQVKFMLAEKVIFDTKKPGEAETYVVNKEDGTIDLKVIGQTSGFVNLTCERAGEASENTLTIYAITPKLTSKPNTFKIGSPVELECSITVVPEAETSGGLGHLVGNETEKQYMGLTQFKQGDGNTMDEEYAKNNYSEVVKVELGTDKSRFYATVTPLNEKAEGAYGCLYGITKNGESVGFAGTNFWYSDNSLNPADKPNSALSQSVNVFLFSLFSIVIAMFLY